MQKRSPKTPPPPKPPWLRESVLAYAERITEDAEDLADIAAFRDDPGMPFDEFVADLKKRGRL